MFNNMTPCHLLTILSAVEPVELKGLALLRRRRPPTGSWFPAGISPCATAEAASEMMAYMQGCQRAMENLKKLPPVPLGIPVEEWPL
jgi:hypothetical protein